MAFHRLFAYEASAGSGKTFALVIRYISLLYRGADPSTILALTFTNKAANEMQSRITAVLSELHLPERDAEREALAKVLECSAEQITARREEILRLYLGADLKISTIDAFFAHILRSFSLYMELMPDFTIDARGVEREVLGRFVQKTLRHGLYTKLIEFALFSERSMTDLFEEYFESFYAIDHELPVSVMECESPQKMERLALERFEQLKKALLACGDLSESGQKALRIESVSEILNATWLARDSLGAYRYFRKCFRKEMDRPFFALKEALVRYMRARECYYKNELFKLYDLYKKARRHENRTRSMVAFDDVSNMVYELLRERIDNDFLYFRLDARIEHILIDEFQDTNVQQFRILEPLIDEIASGIGTGTFKSFFYVGDVKQSIYRFRGGKKELFGFLRDHYGIHMERLNVNYRSASRIVAFVNELFERAMPYYTPQESKEERDGGYVAVEETEDLCASVYAHLQRLRDAGAHSERIAILVQTNDDAYTIKSYLLEHDPTLKVTTETSVPLLHKPKVAAVVELLKYLYFQERYYLANFLTLIGLSWQTCPDLQGLSTALALPLLIRHIIERFDLYSGEPDLLALIELAHDYPDIEAFLFDLDRIDAEAPDGGQEGVRILTVHKSKGLEFAHVIVADKIKKTPPDRRRLFFRYDAIELKKLYLRFSKREVVDEEYKEAWEEETRLVAEDRLNAHYVAFTRAQRSLIICYKPKESSFAMLGLHPTVRGEIEPDPPMCSAPQRKPLKYRPISVGAQEKPRNEQSREPLDLPSIHFGIALHYMLELLHDTDEGTIEEAWWGMVNRYAMVLDRKELEEIRRRVELLVADPRYQGLRSGICRHEQPVVYRGELRVIDMLVEREEGFVVVDYKSGHEKRSEHRRQVAGYLEAVSAIEGKSARGWLCYLHPERIEWVEV